MVSRNGYHATKNVLSRGKDILCTSCPQVSSFCSFFRELIHPCRLTLQRHFLASGGRGGGMIRSRQGAVHGTVAAVVILSSWNTFPVCFSIPSADGGQILGVSDPVTSNGFLQAVCCAWECRKPKHRPKACSCQIASLFLLIYKMIMNRSRSSRFAPTCF